MVAVGVLDTLPVRVNVALCPLDNVIVDKLMVLLPEFSDTASLSLPLDAEELRLRESKTPALLTDRVIPVMLMFPEVTPLAVRGSSHRC